MQTTVYLALKQRIIIINQSNNNFYRYLWFILYHLLNVSLDAHGKCYQYCESENIEFVIENEKQKVSLPFH